jgi:SAM-dependent methyltransferase
MDVGCGTGDLTVQVAKHFAKAIGIDSDPEAIAKAQSRFGGVTGLEFKVGDAGDLDTIISDRERFNGIISVLALHHMQINPVLEWVKLHLADNGTLVIADIYADYKESLTMYLFDQFCWSTIRHLWEACRSIKTIGVLNIASYLGWRFMYSLTAAGRGHIQKDLSRGVPMSLNEWRYLLQTTFPGGSMTLIPGSTVFYVWHRS